MTYPFFGTPSPLAAGAGLVLVETAATCYEIKQYPTSHNLLPFDLIFWVVMAGPLMLGALVGSRLRQRAGPRGLTSD